MVYQMSMLGITIQKAYWQHESNWFYRLLSRYLSTSLAALNYAHIICTSKQQQYTLRPLNLLLIQVPEAVRITILSWHIWVQPTSALASYPGWNELGTRPLVFGNTDLLKPPVKLTVTIPTLTSSANDLIRYWPESSNEVILFKDCEILVAEPCQERCTTDGCWTTS